MAHQTGVGTPYLAAARLLSASVGEWGSFDGWAASRGVDPVDLPLDRYCNLVYFWLTQNAPPEKREEVDEMLYRDAEGKPSEDSGPWAAEAELAAFTQATKAASSV